MQLSLQMHRSIASQYQSVLTDLESFFFLECAGELRINILEEKKEKRSPECYGYEHGRF